MSWSSTDAQTPDFISRDEAWKLYIQKLQDEANYLLNSPDGSEICCCKDCIVSGSNTQQIVQLGLVQFLTICFS